jgi:uncharacterized protein with WD repeat
MNPLSLLLNTKQGVSVIEYSHNDSEPNASKEDQLIVNREINIINQPNEGLIYSSNGQYLAVIYKDRVSVHDITKNYEQVKCISGEDGSSISQVQFSPLNTFLVTLGKYSPQKASNNNLIIWKLFPEASAQDVHPYEKLQCKILLRTRYNKSSSNDIWPIVQWNDNESICAIWQQSHQSLNFYRYGLPQMKQSSVNNQNHEEEQEEQIPVAQSSEEMCFELVSRFKKPKVFKFNLSSKSTFSIHTFNSQTQQHLVEIYRYPNFKKPTCFISFAEEKKGVEIDVNMKWNRSGSALLVHANSSTDTDNENYYGKSQVYFLRSNGHFTCQITLSQSGPVHDVAWSPKGNEFCLVYGYTPAKATLYNESTQIIFEFGTGTRNKCSWAPNGRYLVLAGFGSLTGRMEFWDRDKKRMIGQAEAKEASTYGWSADSRLFVTATVTPTLRVSNKIQIWKYNGVLLYERHFETLYNAIWNHFTPSTITGEDSAETKESKQKQDKDNRPPSPRALNEGKLLMQTKEQTVKKAYVPPSLRMAGMGPVNDSIFKRTGLEVPSKPSKQTVQTSQQQQQMMKAAQLQRMIPGLPNSAALQQITGQSAEAAKKKRKRKKKKKSTESSAVTTEDNSGEEEASQEK